MLAFIENLKNKSSIFSRWDDLITHESQRKAGNWTAGSGREIKLAAHSSCSTTYTEHQGGASYPNLKKEQGRENAKFL